MKRIITCLMIVVANMLCELNAMLAKDFRVAIAAKRCYLECIIDNDTDSTASFVPMESGISFNALYIVDPRDGMWVLFAESIRRGPKTVVPQFQLESHSMTNMPVEIDAIATLHADEIPFGRYCPWGWNVSECNRLDDDVLLPQIPVKLEQGVMCAPSSEDSNTNFGCVVSKNCNRLEGWCKSYVHDFADATNILFEVSSPMVNTQAVVSLERPLYKVFNTNGVSSFRIVPETLTDRIKELKWTCDEARHRVNVAWLNGDVRSNALPLWIGELPSDADEIKSFR